MLVKCLLHENQPTAILLKTCQSFRLWLWMFIGPCRCSGQRNTMQIILLPGNIFQNIFSHLFCCCSQDRKHWALIVWSQTQYFVSQVVDFSSTNCFAFYGYFLMIAVVTCLKKLNFRVLTVFSFVHDFFYLSRRRTSGLWPIFNRIPP